MWLDPTVEATMKAIQRAHHIQVVGGQEIDNVGEARKRAADWQVSIACAGAGGKALQRGHHCGIVESGSRRREYVLQCQSSGEGLV